MSDSFRRRQERLDCGKQFAFFKARMVAQSNGKVLIPLFIKIFRICHHTAQFSVFLLETLTHRSGDILPIWSKHDLFFSKMRFQFKKMSFQLGLVAFSRRTQKADTERKSVMVFAGKFDKCWVAF
ncbi:hypothetical protein HMPREF2568_09225 [Neisseria sp. HMSC059F02]|nr:hypothetical protein HMPREF2638_04565 [Neisseria sp. HMSC055F11]OFN30983.1 hypothetical protein HMPREF2568_09225 [Neisseria sp. HMSC059F02]